MPWLLNSFEGTRSIAYLYVIMLAEVVSRHAESQEEYPKTAIAIAAQILAVTRCRVSGGGTEVRNWSRHEPDSA